MPDNAVSELFHELGLDGLMLDVIGASAPERLRLGDYFFDLRFDHVLGNVWVGRGGMGHATQPVHFEPKRCRKDQFVRSTSS